MQPVIEPSTCSDLAVVAVEGYTSEVIAVLIHDHWRVAGEDAASTVLRTRRTESGLVPDALARGTVIASGREHGIGRAFRTTEAS